LLFSEWINYYSIPVGITIFFSDGLWYRRRQVLEFFAAEKVSRCHQWKSKESSDIATSEICKPQMDQKI
jgi:hypothetical protein